MRIDELLEEASKLFDSHGEYDIDSAANSICKEVSERMAICMPEQSMARVVYDGKLPSSLAMSAIFDLGPALRDCFDGDISLFVLERELPDAVTIGVFEEKANIEYAIVSLDDDETEFEIIDPYRETIEQYLDSGTVDGIWLTTVNNQINLVEYSEFDPLLPYSYCYSKEFLALKEHLAQEDTRPLGEIASIIQPALDAGRRDFVAQRISGYPFKVELDSWELATDTVIEQDDIIVTPEKAFFVDEVPSPSRCVSPDSLVLRCSDVSPRYLLLFLESRTGKALRRVHLAATDPSRPSADDYRGIPVIMPIRSEESIRSVFDYACNRITSADQFDYSVLSSPDGIASKVEYYFLSREDDSVASARRSFDNELTNIAITCHDASVKTMIGEDIAELESCFECGAYKATLILAGSVLEAVLIDWLSEMEGKNYFEEDYTVPDRRRAGQTKPAQLIDYIDAIRAIKRPEWMEEADKAHEIRKKRNLVHAKLCLKSSIEINEETCRMIVGYLVDIIKTRNSQR